MPNLINNGIGLVLDKADLGTKPWQITVKLLSWQGNEREPLAVVGIGTDGSSAVLAGYYYGSLVSAEQLLILVQSQDSSGLL